MSDTRHLVSAAHVAELFHTTTRTVQRWAAAGQLPYVQKLDGPNGDYLFDLDAVEQAFEQAQAQADA